MSIEITKSDVEEYVKTLSSVLWDIYCDADAVRFSEEDTLSSEFQIACDVIDVFYKHARQYYSGGISE